MLARRRSASIAIVGLALVASTATPRLAFAAARSASATSADEVVSLQQNSAHTGSATGDALAPPLVQKWAIDAGSDNTISYPLIAGGRIFVTTMSTTGGASSLRAFNATDGSSAWPPVTLNGWVTAAYDVVNGQGVIFTRSVDNTVKAFNAATGALLWSVTTYNGTASPVAANGLVYISYSNQMTALRESDGTVAWTSPILHGDDTTPAVTATDVYVNYACNHVYDLNATTGAIVWHDDAPCEGGGTHQTPAEYNGRLYTRSSFGNYTWNATTGAALASFSANPPPAFDGALGFFLTARTLQAEDLSTSRILRNLWKMSSLKRKQRKSLLRKKYHRTSILLHNNPPRKNPPREQLPSKVRQPKQPK